MHNLKKYYFINQYNPKILNKLNRNICLIWRSKYKDDKIDEIKKTAEYCRKNKRDLFLANNFRLALKFKLKGLYLSANNKKISLSQNSLPKNFKIIGSAHNLKELNIKKIQKVDEIFLAPMFKKKNNNALGIYKTKYLFENIKVDKIALGGINKKNIKILKFTNFKGFAGIDYFE
tara:strand:- start:86 stop:610 length:525 start_codon:yes stop_codon:yes gene_type:complete